MPAVKWTVPTPLVAHASMADWIACVSGVLPSPVAPKVRGSHAGTDCARWAEKERSPVGMTYRSSPGFTVDEPEFARS